MLHRRLRRLTTAFCAVLSLLFAQLALAQYVCPQQADAEAMAAMVEAGAPCHGMDPDQAVLCHQHAADPAETFETVQMPAAAQPALVRVLELPSLFEARKARAVPADARSAAWPPPDPLFLSTLRLRV